MFFPERVFTLLWQKNKLNLVSLGTKRNYKKVKNYSQPLSWCVSCLVASGSKAAGFREFSKVHSLKRDFVHQSTFHCCCTLLQLCMLQKFQFYPNRRMRKCESVFIKTTVLELHFDWSSNILFVRNILFTMGTADVHLGLQFYN